MEVSVGAKPPRPAAYSTAPAAPPTGKEVTWSQGGDTKSQGHVMSESPDEQKA